ncbi:MAG: hypothetical protein PQJ59_17925 [Spirochaetales bacterium]|nr:hypothetical protein [Spirochaetales bacterium]
MELLFERNFKNVLAVKLWRFRRKSVISYAFGALLMTMGLDMLELIRDRGRTFLIIFPCLLFVSLCAMLLSAFLTTREVVRTVMTLDEEKVTVLESHKTEKVVVLWPDIKVVEDKKNIYLRSKSHKYFYYWISKGKLGEEKMGELRGLLVSTSSHL